MPYEHLIYIGTTLLSAASAYGALKARLASVEAGLADLRAEVRQCLALRPALPFHDPDVPHRAD